MISLRRPRLRRPNLEHLAFDVELVAWVHRQGPAEFVETGADDAADRLEIALYEQPHGHCGGPPKIERRAASSSWWKGCGSNSAAKVLIRSASIRTRPDRYVCPGAKS